jgi:hypothetical protein
MRSGQPLAEIGALLESFPISGNAGFRFDDPK